MDWLSTLLSVCLIAAAVSMAWRERLLRQRMARGVAGDREGHAAATRMLRLVAGDMRGVALGLLGYADAVALPDGISGTACRLLNLSEDLLNQTEAPDSVRRLDEGSVALLPIVEFAMAQVAAELGAAQRAWRIAPELAAITLHADPRALNQVFVLVISSAAACTRRDDWIEISGLVQGGEWVLTVEDEGVGLPVLHADGEAHESRGLGIGLTLAKSLMAAHGGTLRIETAARVGTRVRLGFPAERLLASPDSAPRFALS